MIRTFVINLEESTDRWEKIHDQLVTLNISHERFNAINIKNCTPKEIEEIYDKNKSITTLGRELRKGEIGCAASHIEIYKKMIKENIPIALVLEDDGIISPKLKNIYQKILKKGSIMNYDYITLNYTNFDIKGIKKYTQYLHNSLIKNRKIVKAFIYFAGMIFYSFIDLVLNIYSKIFGYIIVPRYKPVYLTGGYFITKKGAEKLLGINHKIFVPSDILPEKYRKTSKLKIGCVIPIVIKQDSKFKSTVQVKK